MLRPYTRRAARRHSRADTAATTRPRRQARALVPGVTLTSAGPSHIVKTERSVFSPPPPVGSVTPTTQTPRSAPPLAGARKGELTRRRIVERAAPVFNQRGYAGTSLSELVAATGLEKGGIYNHFA